MEANSKGRFARSDKFLEAKRRPALANLLHRFSNAPNPYFLHDHRAVLQLFGTLRWRIGERHPYVFNSRGSRSN
jgi:hypothetical protein